MPLPQPLAQGAKQFMARRFELIAQALRSGLERRKVIAIGFDQVAHALDWIGFEAGGLVAAGKPRRRHGLAAARLDIGAIEALHGVRRVGTELDQIAQLLLRQLHLPKQRIAEHLVQLSEKAILVGGGEVTQVDVIGLRHLEQDLRRHRALIALDEIDVAR